MMIKDLFRKKDVYVLFSMEPPANEAKFPLSMEPPAGEIKLPRSVPVGEKRPTPCVADSGIAYYEDLISRFCDEHASLRKLLNTIRKCVMNDAFAGARNALQTFRSVLTAHLLDEHIKLYAYLSPRLAEVPEHKKLLLTMKSEKGRISAAVTYFVSNYTNPVSISRNRQQFLLELDDISAALLDHIEREETSLYVLYTPGDGLPS